MKKKKKDKKYSKPLKPFANDCHICGSRHTSNIDCTRKRQLGWADK